MAAVKLPEVAAEAVNLAVLAERVSICIVRPSFVTRVSARALIRLRAGMPPNVNMLLVMAAVFRKALAFLRKRRTGTRRILTTTVRSGRF